MFLMDTLKTLDWWVWLAIAVVVIAVIVAVVMAAKGGTKAQRREKAESLRQEIRERGVRAERTEAEALKARADAEEARLRADALESEAGEHRDAMADQIQKANRLDPDVDNDES